MDLDDFFGSQTAIAVGLTAAVLSPRARKVLRRGAVYGVAGVLVAGDAVSSAARGARHGARQAAATAESAYQGASERVSGTEEA